MDLIDKVTDLIKPAKATLVAVSANKPDGEAKLECMFNPTKYHLSQKVGLNRLEKPLPRGVKAQYQSTSALTLKMELFFDDFASGKGDVTKQISTLLSWQVPTSQSGNRPRPPLIKFNWGNKQLTKFQGILTSVDVDYTMFRRDGNPIQATANITLVGDEVEVETNLLQTTNPTSHATDSRRVRTLVAGESLQSVAYEELGKATYWRALAELNGIDDPLRVQPGRVLLIPTVADAARGS